VRDAAAEVSAVFDLLKQRIDGADVPLTVQEGQE